MNAKKITSLVLAAVMAAGTTVTAFAESHVTGTNGSDLSADRPLGFSDATIYEDKDGVLVPSTDYRPGDTFYIRLKELDSNGNKKIEDEKDDMQVYADWKVGKNAVEDVDIVYDKGAVKYTFNVNDVEFVVNSAEKLDYEELVSAVESEIAAYLADHPTFLDADRDKLYKVTSGYVVNGQVKNGSEYDTHKAGYAFVGVDGLDSKNKVYAGNTSGIDEFINDYFIYTENDIDETLYSKDKSAYITSGFVGTSAPDTGYQSFNNPNVLLTGTSGEVFYINENETKVTDANVLANQGIVKITDKDILADKTTHEIVNAIEITDTDYVYAIRDNEGSLNVVSEKEATEATIRDYAEAAVRAKYEVVYDGDWTYWVKISTKKDDTTKVLDLAGILYIGGSKTKAEKSDNTFQFDTSMDNRVYDDNKYVEVEDEWTFYPNSRSVVKFSDDAEDVVLYFGENEDAWFEVDARGQSALNMEFDFDWNEEIADLFPNANIDFLNFTSTPAFNRTGDLWITADPDTFIYEVTEDGVKEIANAEYDEDEEAWHIRTRKLTAYAISDRELDTSKTLDGEDNTSSSNTSNNGGKDNPDTGR